MQVSAFSLTPQLTNEIKSLGIITEECFSSTTVWLFHGRKSVWNASVVHEHTNTRTYRGRGTFIVLQLYLKETLTLWKKLQKMFNKKKQNHMLWSLSPGQEIVLNGWMNKEKERDD